eukprot:TRINITY_DN1349_c0_g1_i5.p2 TRINITY_DN1349_c0_g1~~TRINITY_DN1349_c0_g1_i5.p2  ORF type:complete len:190 (-),score=36.62 TRINITY_DN1349_c0_g1_i5:102-671(-)
MTHGRRHAARHTAQHTAERHSTAHSTRVQHSTAQQGRCISSTNNHPPKHIFLECHRSVPSLRAIRPRPCIAVDVENARRGWHPAITCAECGEKPIKGPRYKCMVCDQYDLCKGCAATRREQLMVGDDAACSHDAEHVFARGTLKVQQPAHQRGQRAVQSMNGGSRAPHRQGAPKKKGPSKGGPSRRMWG